ncbi:MAG: ribosome biogenesis GTPase Der [Candidatus Wallbacteria bacterium HGW-Wallbacteria-1]|jgi:GTP-binding protein|uniref:GTPase Der n=1 Tax=Candidatus Wallbacteria bacterium HGW-Wallbacteria-1 TaxID=2013854 RepID=A0A2N1PTI7_9BACT|nr:MAG: ribosome biogenesis GTPase Der [Candidatus Wallbacteria bacterium HGW-Wallbacteria-1]
MNTLPTVAIVGRPNVGKSTLFNRIIGWQHAIVDDRPGITRDRNVMTATWNGTDFELVDTGGLEMSSFDDMMKMVREQVQYAIDTSDLILFVVDGREGVNPGDHEVANYLRASKKPVILAVNKIDGDKLEDEIYDFYSLGLDEPYPISSGHGRGVGDLLDILVANIPIGAKVEEKATGIAIVGKPNVGKSTLLNMLCGDERTIVSPVAGTTRDSIDTRVTINDTPYRIIDTAGLRRKARVHNMVERFAVLRTIRAVERADVVLLLIDLAEGVGEQERKIAGIAKRKGKGLILVINKWDLVQKGGDLHGELTIERKHYVERLGKEFLPFAYARTAFISAATGKGVNDLIPMVEEIMAERNKRIQTSVLNEFIRNISFYHPPPVRKKGQLKIYYATQTEGLPPTFVLFVNNSELMHFSYQRYIDNSLREQFGFQGTPIRILSRNKGKSDN